MSDNDADALNATITTGMIMNFIMLSGGDCLRSFIVGFLEVAVISSVRKIMDGRLFHF